MIDRKAIHDLVDKVLDVQERTGHYVCVELENCGSEVKVYVMEGGFSEEKSYSLLEYFSKADGGAMRKVMAYLDSLLKDEPQTGGAVRDSGN